jgi:hypothetical protein
MNTIRKNIGISFRRMQGSDDCWYLTAVVWYRNGRKSLGYLYPSIRLTRFRRLD